MERRMRLTSFGIVALQLVFILGLVAYKEVTLRFGTEVMLQTVPVDPRDLFRGDYVTLRYGISTLERSRIWFSPTMLHRAIGCTCILCPLRHSKMGRLGVLGD